MIRATGCVGLTGVVLALHQSGLLPTWLAATVGILAMVTATVLVAIEEIR